MPCYNYKRECQDFAKILQLPRVGIKSPCRLFRAALLSKKLGLRGKVGRDFIPTLVARYIKVGRGFFVMVYVG